MHDNSACQDYNLEGIPSASIVLERRIKQRVEGAWKLVGIGVNQNDFDQWLECKKGREAQTTLAPDVWTFLQTHIPDGAKTFAHQLPEARFENGAISLIGLSLAVTRQCDDLQTATVVAGKVVGNPKYLFASGRAPNLLAGFDASLAAHALENVVLPALNLAAWTPSQDYQKSCSDLSAFVRRLNLNRHDLEFYAALMPRLVAQSDPTSPYANNRVSRLQNPKSATETASRSGYRQALTGAIG